MTPQKILLVEDAVDIQKTVQAILSSNFQLKIVSTAEDALRALQETAYSLILLDVGLPDEDGFKFCAKLKVEEKYKKTPVVFLTGKQDVSDKVMGFSLGAEDYIVKPFEPLEFKARIEAKMRLINEHRSHELYFCDGAFKVNLDFQKIYRIKNTVESDLGLTTIEFKIFYYFLTHEEHVLSRDQILNHVWGENTHVSDRTVDTHVYTLRQKLGDYASGVQSVPRVGYKFCKLKIIG